MVTPAYNTDGTTTAAKGGFQSRRVNSSGGVLPACLPAADVLSLPTFIAEAHALYGSPATRSPPPPTPPPADPAPVSPPRTAATAPAARPPRGSARRTRPVPHRWSRNRPRRTAPRA